MKSAVRMFFVWVLVTSSTSISQESETAGKEGTGVAVNVKARMVWAESGSTPTLWCFQGNRVLKRETLGSNTANVVLPNSGVFNLVIHAEHALPLVIWNVHEFRNTLDFELPRVVLPSLTHDRKQRDLERQRHLVQVESARVLALEIPEAKELIGALDECTAILTTKKPISFLIPCYFYPSKDSTEWPKILAFAKECKRAGIDLQLILNIYNGSGKKDITTGATSLNGNALGVNQDYVKLTGQLKQAGIPWLGYLATQYGNRRGYPIEEDAAFWLANYPGINGFFIDELPSDGSYANTLRTLRGGVDKKTGSGKLDKRFVWVGNPGTSFDRAYNDKTLLDAICISENIAPSQRFQRPEWLSVISSPEIGVLTQGIASTKEIDKLVDSFVQESGRLLFIHDIDPNKETGWTRMPNKNLLDHLIQRTAAWNEEVRAGSKTDKR